MRILKYNTMPLRIRGYKYRNVHDLIDNKDDPELLISHFENNFKSFETRTALVGWVYRFAQSPYFRQSRTNTICLAIELLDKIMLSIQKLPNISDLRIIIGSCMYIAHGEFSRGVESDDFTKFIAENSSHYNYKPCTTEKIIETVSIILERFGCDISYEYSVMWFINWLGGFEHPGCKYRLGQEVLKVYLTGEYRSLDPYTMACKIMLSM